MLSDFDQACVLAVYCTLHGWLCQTSDFVLSSEASIAVRENGRSLSPSSPSAALSTAHLHIDGESMGSLQSAVNITNDQFKLALTTLLKAALTHCYRPWRLAVKSRVSEYIFQLILQELLQGMKSLDGRKLPWSLPQMVEQAVCTFLLEEWTHSTFLKQKNT